MRRIAPLLALAAALAAPTAATASQLIDRDAGPVRLEVNSRGRALLVYRAHGVTRHVLAWGAVNAIAPTRDRRQVEFTLDYSGGRGAWRRFRNVCAPYDGPPLSWLVTACRAPDGSYWAVQSWQRLLPNYGGSRAPRELHLSHWAGPLPVLQVGLDWSYRRFDHLYGRLTYHGVPVYGFRSTSHGSPLDTFGRNVYVDTFDSAYGAGWRRENAFLTHRGTGAFCYGFYPHEGDRTGKGSRYRATVSGPGVTPLVTWSARALGGYNPGADRVANQAVRALGDRRCRPN